MDIGSGDLISLMLAISTDEKKNARLAEIHEAQAALDTSNEEARTLAEEMRARNADAGKMVAHAQELYDAASAKHSALDTREKALGDVLESLNAEKAAWSAIREKVDREQAERRDQLEALAAALTNREVGVSEREKFVTAREQAAAEAQGKYEGLLDRARMLLDLDATPDVPKRAAKK